MAVTISSSLTVPSPSSCWPSSSSISTNCLFLPSSCFASPKTTTSAACSVLPPQDKVLLSEGASCSRRHALISAAVLLATPFLGIAANANAAEEDVVLNMVRGEIKLVLTKLNAPSTLRLVFHDAGTFDLESNTGGMNGSIVMELERKENFGLKKPVKNLRKAKERIDQALGAPVSWADLIAVAGAEAVAICGGPQIPVRLGRLDSVEEDPEGRLPEETLTAAQLKEVFKEKGFSVQELVALSGSHTIGNKGFGDPTAFDNAYYQILAPKPDTSAAANGGSMGAMIGLQTDRALLTDDECLVWIKRYAEDQDIFFTDFSKAFVKMVDSSARWASI